MSQQRTITVWDKCTTEGCNRILHSIKEGERGLCSSCWFKTIPPDAKKAMNRLIASAFNGSTAEQKDQAVDDVMERSNRGEYA